MLKLKLKDKKYKSFIDYASKTCDSISLVFEKDETDNSRYTFQEEYQTISQSIIKIVSAGTNENTGSCFENADIIFLNIDSSVMSFLKQATSIIDWNGMRLPEELCFYRKEKIWFTCIYHERLFHIHNETSDDLDFLKENNIEFVYEI